MPEKERRLLPFEQKNAWSQRRESSTEKNWSEKRDTPHVPSDSSEFINQKLKEGLSVPNLAISLAKMGERDHKGLANVLMDFVEGKELGKKGRAKIIASHGATNLLNHMIKGGYIGEYNFKKGAHQEGTKPGSNMVLTGGNKSGNIEKDGRAGRRVVNENSGEKDFVPRGFAGRLLHEQQKSYYSVNMEEENKSETGFIRNFAKKFGAKVKLSSTARSQYPWLKAAPLTPTTSVIINSRIDNSISKVESNKASINNTATKYGVPNEIIGGIIFKEQLTSILPDSIANIDAYFDGYLIPGSTPTHSTGLGAIFPSTARDAWGKVDPAMTLPASDKELQYKLSKDKDFNIKTIAAVLIYYAIDKKLISSSEEAKNLSQEQWKKVVAVYNGSDEYARKVYEYLQDIGEILD